MKPPISLRIETRNEGTRAHPDYVLYAVLREEGKMDLWQRITSDQVAFFNALKCTMESYGNLVS